MDEPGGSSVDRQLVPLSKVRSARVGRRWWDGLDGVAVDGSCFAAVRPERGRARERPPRPHAQSGGAPPLVTIGSTKSEARKRLVNGPVVRLPDLRGTWRGMRRQGSCGARISSESGRQAWSAWLVPGQGGGRIRLPPQPLTALDQLAVIISEPEAPAGGVLFLRLLRLRRTRCLRRLPSLSRALVGCVVPPPWLRVSSGVPLPLRSGSCGPRRRARSRP